MKKRNRWIIFKLSTLDSSKDDERSRDILEKRTGASVATSVTWSESGKIVEKKAKGNEVIFGRL